MLEPSGDTQYEAVEEGLDPLSLPADPTADPYLHDYSLCGFGVNEDANPRLTFSGDL